MSGEIYFISTIVGGCALLIAGMQLVSNNILELCERPIYKMIRGTREDRFLTFFKGIFFSAFASSSFVASTTLLNLVNAGLLRLRAAYIFLAGANLGSFLLLGIVVFLNLKMGLVFLALSVITQFLTRGYFVKWFQNIHRFLLGLGLICLAKYFLADGVRIISMANYGLLESVTQGPFVLSLVTGLFFGTIICHLLRSSLLTILLLMVIRDGALVSLNLLLPAVVGVHAVGFIQLKKIADQGNIHAKRLAMGQLAISLLGFVIGVISLFIVDQFNFDKSGTLIIWFFAWIRLGSIIFYMIFLGTIIRSIFVLLPDNAYSKHFELSQLGSSRDMIPAMALLQCSFHVSKLKGIVDRLFTLTEEFLYEEEPSARVLAKIKDYERITDNMHKEIRSFVVQLMENSLSSKQSMAISQILKIADELEYIADYIDKLASYHTRHRLGPDYAQEKAELMEFFAKVKQFYFDVCDDLPHHPALDEVRIKARSQRLKISADAMRESCSSKMCQLEGDEASLMGFSDMIVCLRKIRGHVLRVYTALYWP